MKVPSEYSVNVTPVNNNEIAHCNPQPTASVSKKKN